MKINKEFLQFSLIFQAKFVTTVRTKESRQNPQSRKKSVKGWGYPPFPLTFFHSVFGDRPSVKGGGGGSPLSVNFLAQKQCFWVKYRLQGTFYWIKNGKKVPIKTIEIRVKNRVAVKSAPCSEIKRRSLFTGVRLFICNLNARHK